MSTEVTERQIASLVASVTPEVVVALVRELLPVAEQRGLSTVDLYDIVRALFQRAAAEPLLQTKAALAVRQAVLGTINAASELELVGGG